MARDVTKASKSVGDPLDEARRIIDRDIARLEENIRSLKSRRNELSPISRFPPEILCNIFSFIENRTMSQNRRPESWINFSRVSRQWRLLALGAPELWTNIPIRYPRWAEEMLARSKMAKLVIQVDLTCQSPTSRVLDPIRSCLSQMIRLEEINIFGASGSTLKQLFQDIPKSAPQLHTLRIYNTSPPTGYLTAPLSAFTIQEDFLSDTERLRCVQLIKCNIGWDSRLLTGLTRLTLHDSLKDQPSSSIIQFLHALQRMPALTNLDLEDSIPHDPGELSTYPVADLPCLRVLRMSSGVGPLTAALRHITFPSEAELTLICKETRSAQLNFSTFLSVLAAKFLSSLVIRSLSLKDLDATAQIGLRFKVWSTRTVDHDFFQYSLHPVPPRLELVLTWRTSPLHGLQKYAKALTATFDAMNLRALTQLELSTSNYIDSKTWLKTFAKLSRLERVHVKGNTADSFISALVHKSGAAKTSIAAYRTVSLPKLRYICMDGTDFDETSLGSISIEKLMNCLMERYERNAEVQGLCLDDCYNITDIEVKALREIVVHVDWDGVEQGFSDEYDSEEEREYDSDGNIIDDDYDEDDFPFGYGGDPWGF
ncbi:hypothetical protein BYT27DRAFT_7187793 [Phlegmacium glaucopus]|nr:hypothetical protein BYT27DRAFT_7187793 [Phlegmacium glaucopus]